MQLEPSQADAVRTLIADADRHIDAARRQLEEDAPDYLEVVNHSVSALESTFRAFIAWHSQPAGDDTSLRRLGKRAVSLDSAFTTSAHLAPAFAELGTSLASKDDFSIEDIEGARRSFFVARNAHSITHNALPPAILADAADPVQ